MEQKWLTDFPNDDFDPTRALGTMIAYSTQPDNVAFDGTGRNSPFTTALINHLTDPGVDIDVIMKRVRGDVIAATQQR